MENIFKWNDTSENKQKHHFLLPSPSLRGLIIGPSNCGKTSLLFRLLLENDWLDYNSLYIYSKSLHQPEYKLLKGALERGYSKSNIRKLFKNGSGNIDEFLETLSPKGKPVSDIYCYDNEEQIPDPRNVDVTSKNLFVFDDVANEKNQSNATDFYTRGRHNNCSSIYLSQNYHLLPRQTIRSNANFMILFELPYKDLENIHRDFVVNDMTWTEFKKFASISQPYEFIVLNKDKNVMEGKYMKNLNTVYIPKKFLHS